MQTCLCPLPPLLSVTLQDPQVQEAVAELQQRKQVLADLQAKYKAALEEAAAAEAAPPTVESWDEAEAAEVLDGSKQ